MGLLILNKFAGIILDYNDENEVVGLEMLHLSKRSPNLTMSALEFEAL